MRIVLRNDVPTLGKRGDIQDVLGQAVHRSRGPGAVAVASQVQRVDVKVLAQCARHPVPVAGMVEATVNEQQRWLVVLSKIPELQFEAVGIEEMRDWFQSSMLLRAW